MSSGMIRRHWLLVLLVLLALALALGGCLQDSALAYDQLHISATRTDGTPVVTSPRDGCVTLPVLLGSRAEQTVVIASPLAIETAATRDKVRLHFRGAASASSFDRTFLAEDLRAPFADDLNVQSDSGESFVIQLRAGCPDTPDSGS